MRWIGDDAAVVRARPFAVTSIDTIADGVHFERSTHSPDDIGHKALAVALSDLAAMGADRRRGLRVARAAGRLSPRRRRWSWSAGMTALARETHTTIAGGDVVRAARSC